MTHEIYRTEGSPSIEELTDKARKIVIENKKASLSLVQRHLGIGYNTTAKMSHDHSSPEMNREHANFEVNKALAVAIGWTLATNGLEADGTQHVLVRSGRNSRTMEASCPGDDEGLGRTAGQGTSGKAGMREPNSACN